MSATRYCKNLSCANIIPQKGIDECLVCYMQSMNNLKKIIKSPEKPKYDERDD
jgi:hypothetical protein